MPLSVSYDQERFGWTHFSPLDEHIVLHGTDDYRVFERFLPSPLVKHSTHNLADVLFQKDVVRAYLVVFLQSDV